MNEVKFLQIEPTTRCNFSCKFCCGRHFDQIDLGYEEYKNIIDCFEDVSYLELQGEGEPLLNSSFFDMVTYAKQKGIKVSTITNGSLFTDKNIEALLNSGMDSIYVSIESVEKEQFKKIRGGNLEAVISGIEKLIKLRNNLNMRKPTIGFAVTVLNETKEMINEIFNIYSELGMDGGITIQFLNKTENYAKYYDEGMQQQTLSQKEKMLVYRNYCRMNAKIHKSTSAEHFFDALLRAKTNENEMNKGCIWLQHALYINAKGEVAPCVYVKEACDEGICRFSIENIDKLYNQRNIMYHEYMEGKVPSICKKINCDILTERIR